MQTADDLFGESIGWLRDNYHTFRFFMERDIVWTIHLRLLHRIAEQDLPYTVSYNHPMGGGVLADLVLLDPYGAVRVAAEFKYEPSHARPDIPKTKLPVAFWKGAGSVEKDVERVQAFVANGKARVAYCIFIDEGRFFRNQAPHHSSQWIDWEQPGPGAAPSLPAILWSRVAAHA